MNTPFWSGGGSGVAEADPEPTALNDSLTQSLVDQLAALYQEKQELQEALGVSTSAEIVELFAAQAGESMVASLTAQLHSLYADHEELRAAIGCDQPGEIVALVEDLRSSVRSLVDDARRRLTIEFNLLKTHERSLT